MDRFLFAIIACFILAVPAYANDSFGGDLDGSALSDPTDVLISSDPTVETDSASDPVVLEADEENISALDISGTLAGGYYFVCDCALGSDVKFYVPLEWAHDVFTLDSSGAPVNLSMNTCYAFSPQFPDYTISCSRFATFTYRQSNYSTSDLNISNISDTNIQFMEDEGFHLSDSDILVLIAGLLFILVVGSWILRR